MCKEICVFIQCLEEQNVYSFLTFLKQLLKCLYFFECIFTVEVSAGTDCFSGCLVVVYGFDFEITCLTDNIFP